MSILLSATIDNDSTVLIIWGICIGVVLGFVFNFLTRAITGPFVRALLFKNAIGEDSGLTLGELGFLNKNLIKLALRDGSALRNTVSVVGGSLPTISAGGKTAVDYSKARFYISTNKKEKAQATFGEGEKWYLLIIFVALAIGCAYAMTEVVPLLVEALF